MRGRDFLISLPESMSGFRCLGNSSISFSITLMTLAKCEEPWGRALQVELDGGARVVVLEGETLEVVPEEMPKGRALEVAPEGESHDDGTLEVATQCGAQEVELEGGSLQVGLEGGTLVMGSVREAREVVPEGEALMVETEEGAQEGEGEGEALVVETEEGALEVAPEG